MRFLDCKLYIKETSGTLDYTALPSYNYDLCTVQFPSQAMDATTSEPPGLLVQLTRLNVPCDSGGYVIFSDQDQLLCGKLEDLSKVDRTYYYPSHQHTAVMLQKRPVFSLNFKLVDYCYNITLTERNHSMLLEPRRAIECYFKVHMPYGNQIELNLLINFYTRVANGSVVIERTAVRPTTQRPEKTTDPMNDPSSSSLVDYEYIDMNVPQLGGIAERTCRGIAMQIDDIDSKSWSHCFYGTSPARRLTFRSSGNVLVIRVRKGADTEVDTISDGDGGDVPSVFIEYNAVPIPELVSQCAFGWVAVHQFCITAVHSALPWSLAEMECKKRSGHLASIKSEREQKIIDALLLNSVAFKESAAYWVGASDEIFEGDFRWSNGFPYTYSSELVGVESSRLRCNFPGKSLRLVSRLVGAQPLQQTTERRWAQRAGLRGASTIFPSSAGHSNENQSDAIVIELHVERSGLQREKLFFMRAAHV